MQQGPRLDTMDSSTPPLPNLNVAEYASPYPLDKKESQVSNADTADQAATPPCDYLPSEVMEALIEEDMERLRARRRKRNQQRHFQQYAHTSDAMPSPSGSTFSHDSSSSSASILLGLGTGVGFKDILPLKSCFYDWCCEYFTETQMRVSDRQHSKYHVAHDISSNQRIRSPAASNTTNRSGDRRGTRK